MSNVTQPREDIPIGFVTIGGQRFDCATNPEFVKFFSTLLGRAGGTSADTINSDWLLGTARTFGPRAPLAADVRGDSAITVTRDAQGFSLSFVPEAIVASVMPYLPKAPVQQVDPAAFIQSIVPFLPRPAPAFSLQSASSILESQIFGN